MSVYDVRFYKEEMFCVAVAVPDHTTLNQLIETSVDEIFNNSEWIHGMSVLYDLRNVKKLSENNFNNSLKSAEFANSYLNIIGDGKRAVLVSNDAIFGVFRQFMILRQITEETYNVFNDPNEAYRWLNVEKLEILTI